MTVVSSLVIEMAANVARLKTDMDAARKTVEGATDSMAKAARSAQQALGALGLGFVGFQGAQAMVAAADSVTLLGNKLKLASKDASEAALAYSKILEIANRSKVSFTELGNTYAAISRSTQQLGISQEQLFKVTESIANAMTVSGGSAESMKAALVQLGQGMASGTLRGEELNSVMEQTPRLAQALADGMGISIGQLREMGQDGKITSQAVVDALESQFEKLKKEVGESAVTIGQAYQVLKNSSTDFVGALDVVNQASSTFADAILAAGKAVDDFSVILRAMGATGKDASKDLGFLLTVQDGLAIGFETVAVLGVNLKFVLVSIGREIGGIAAQAAAFMTGNFAEAAAIGREMRADAVAARTEVDRQTAAILNARAVRDSLVGAKGYDEPRFAKMLRAETDELKRQQPIAKQTAQEKAEAARKATAAAKELADAMATYQGLMAKESGLSASFAGDWDKISLAYTKGKITADQLLEAQRVLLDQQPLMRDAAEERAKLEKQLSDQQTKTIDDAWKTVDAIDAQIKSENTKIATLGMAKSAVAELTLAEYERSMADLQRTDRSDPRYIESLQARIDKQKELIAVMKTGEVQEASAEAAKKAAEDWKRASEQINQSLTDALMRGFESGKSFAQNLRDTLKNMFGTLILRPVIQAVVGGVTGLGGASASAGGLSSLFGGGGGGAGSLGVMDTVSKVYSTITGGFTALGDKVAFAAQDIGAWLTTNTTGALNSAGSSLMGGAGTLGTIGSYAGGALAGYGIGKAISGQYTTGLGKNTLEVGGTALGAAIGSVIPGLGTAIGAALGGALGGAINRAFGMGAKNTTGEGLTGTLGAGGASVRAYSDWQQKGGMFRSDKSGRDYSAVNSELGAFLNDSIATMRTGVTGYAAAIGLSADAVNGFSKSIDISLKGLDAAGRQKAITDVLGGFGEDLANAALGTAGTAFVRTGETATQALARLSGSLQGVNTILDTLNQSALGVSLSGADAASKLADLFGGLQGMQQATSAYYQTYHTEAERTAKTTEQLTASLATMGAKLPDSIPAWRALVEAQDKTTEAGRKNWAMLIQLAPAFAQVTGAADSLAAKLGKVVSQLATEALTQVDKQITASTAAADAARAAANAYRDASTSLTDAVKSIMGAVGDVRQNAEQAYGTALASARGGDVTAMQALPQLATAMLAQQRNGAGNSLQAALQAAKAATELSGVSSVANALGVQKDYQAKLYDVNTATLEVLRSSLASGNATVDQLKALSATLTNVGQMLVDSDKLTVGAVTTSSGLIKATLVDTSGRVVGTLDNNSALNLNGLNGQTGILSKLGADQILKLQASTGVQTDALAVQEIATRATAGSSATLTDVLAQLKLPDPSLTIITDQIANGNFAIVNGLSGVVGAINNQTQAQQAEIKRQQDLTKAQKDIEALVNTYRPQIDAMGASLNAKREEKAGYDSQIAAVAPNYNAWSYGTRWNFDWVWKPGSARLAGEIAQAESALGNMTNTYNGQLEAMRAQIRALGGVPAFATGGMHTGGLRLVGENGPELEVTGPARIFNAQQTQDMLRASTAPLAVQTRGAQQGDPALRQLVADLTNEVANLRIEARASAVASQDHLQLTRRMTRNGQSMPITGVQNDTIKVEVAA